MERSVKLLLVFAVLLFIVLSKLWSYYNTSGGVGEERGTQVDEVLPQAEATNLKIKIITDFGSPRPPGPEWRTVQIQYNKPLGSNHKSIITMGGISIEEQRRVLAALSPTDLRRRAIADGIGPSWVVEADKQSLIELIVQDKPLIVPPAYRTNSDDDTDSWLTINNGHGLTSRYIDFTDWNPDNGIESDMGRILFINPSAPSSIAISDLNNGPITIAQLTYSSFENNLDFKIYLNGYTDKAFRYFEGPDTSLPGATWSSYEEIRLPDI